MACIPVITTSCVLDAIGGAAGGAATTALGNGFADAMRDGAQWVIRTTVGWWIDVPPIDLTTSPELSAKGQRLRFDVRLQRVDDDWRVLAPPRGDWGAVTTVLSRSPDGLISYGGQR